MEIQGRIENLETTWKLCPYSECLAYFFHLCDTSLSCVTSWWTCTVFLNPFSSSTFLHFCSTSCLSPFLPPILCCDVLFVHFLYCLFVFSAYIFLILILFCFWEHSVVLRPTTDSALKDYSLWALGLSYRVPGIRSGSAISNASTLPTVILVQPQYYVYFSKCIYATNAY